VTLPCCGLEGKEETSSTRFCAACMLQMAMTRPDPSTSNEYPPWDREPLEPPVDQFYRNDCQTETCRFIECPRCRDILIVNIEKQLSHNMDDESDDDESSGCDCSDCRPNRVADDWTHPKTAQSITVQRPSFKDRCQYAGKKVGVAQILWRAACLHYSFMPREALGRNSENTEILRLVSWGILNRVPGKKNAEELFRMDRGDQVELIKIFDLQHIHTTEESEKLIVGLLAGMGCSIWTFLKEFRIDRAFRMANRSGLLILFMKNFLPPFPLSMWQEWVVTALNVFLVTMMIQFVCIAIIYAASFFGVGLSVCYFLRCSNNSKSSWWLLALGSYFAYRFATCIYNSPSITLFGMVAPKAVVAIKEFIYG